MQTILPDWMSALRVPESSSVQFTAAEPHFPRVSGINLERVSLQLPEELDGELNLLLLAFKQWHQSLIDQWLPSAKALEARYPRLRYYELPTLDSFSAPQRLWINEGMRAGIPDPVARERTITLYLDEKPLLLNAIGIASQQTIYTLLVTRSGEIIWQRGGEFTPQKGAQLQEQVQHFFREESAA